MTPRRWANLSAADRWAFQALQVQQQRFALEQARVDAQRHAAAAYAAAQYRAALIEHERAEASRTTTWVLLWIFVIGPGLFIVGFMIAMAVAFTRVS